MRSSPIDEIKSRLDIVDLIQGYVRLQKSGVNFRALCPFHKEKTPSFFVSPSRQTWHCFGCSEGGDHFSFVQKFEGLEFLDVLRLLAQRTGVELQREDPARRTQRSGLLEVCEAATRFFEKQLEASQQGKSAYAYLAERGLRDEGIKEFRLGFAPNAQAPAYHFLRELGFDAALIEQAGLAMKYSASYRDRFHGRIMFPIFDHHGNIVGFTGRIFGRETADGDPKYLNTPQTPLFDKGKVLYGFDRAKTEIRKVGAAILVEGQMDLLLAHQAGTTHAVATSGTALTEMHVRALKRLTDTLVFCFDMDRAGEEAARRALGLALEQDLMVKAVMLPEAKDPADLIAHNAAAWQEAIAQSVPVVEFFLARARAAHDPHTPEGKRATALSVLPLIKRIANSIEQAHWVGEVAQAIGVGEAHIWEELKRIQVSETQGRNAETGSAEAKGVVADTAPKNRRELLEEALLALAVQFPETVRPRVIEAGILFSPRAHAAADTLFGGTADTQESREHLERIRMRMEADNLAIAPGEHEEECRRLCRELKLIIFREELEELESQLQASERAGDAAPVEETTKRIAEIMEQIRVVLSQPEKSAMMKELFSESGSAAQLFELIESEDSSESERPEGFSELIEFIEPEGSSEPERPEDSSESERSERLFESEDSSESERPTGGNNPA